MAASSPRNPRLLRFPVRLLVAALLGLLAVVAVTFLKTLAGQSGPVAARERRGSEVVVQGHRIVVLRAPALGYAPEERAASVEVRIRGIIEAGQLGPVMVEDTPQGKLVKIGDRVAFALLPDDLDTIAGETLDGAAERAAQKLRGALAEEAESRSLSALIHGVAYVVLATLLYVGLVVLVVYGMRWSMGRLRSLTERHAASLAGLGLGQAPQTVVEGLLWLLRIASWLVEAVATYGWVAFSLSHLPYTRALGQKLASFVLSVLESVAVSLASWVPGLVFVTVIFTVTYYVTRGVRLFFDAVEAGTVRLPQALVETAQPTKRLVVLCIWIFALVEAYPHLPGAGTDAFKGISVFIGLVVSLGGTGVIGHAMSGLVLMFARALKPGDYIRVGDYEGTVISLGTLSTKLRTPWLEEVNVPNQYLAGTTMMNYSRAARRTGILLHTSVTIGYDAPWRQVHAMLEEAATRTRGLLREPAPYVLQRALSDFYVQYELCATLARPEERVAVLAELHANIQDAFNERGVQIMSPHYFGDPAKPKVVPQEAWRKPPA
ncbi:MAG TPA: mechanosensitive ion channel domain-containing protein [Anaeromyxobacter sp.]|nr:mechanosensitive ion channel domain-containing protein [Anaeromyxobacter sp.]